MARLPKLFCALIIVCLYTVKLVPVFASETTLYLGPIEKSVETGEVKSYIPAASSVAVKCSGINCPSALSYLHTDHLGSVVLETDTNGNWISDHTYYPYGKQFNNSTGQSNSDKLYTGQRKDSSSDLYFYNARYYNPATAKFISADKAQGPNRYAYVSNNPIMRNDPSGQWECENEDCEKGPKKTKQQTSFNVGNFSNLENELASVFASTMNSNPAYYKDAAIYARNLSLELYKNKNTDFAFNKVARQIYNDYASGKVLPQGLNPLTAFNSNKVIANQKWKFFGKNEYLNMSTSQLTSINIALILSLAAVESGADLLAQSNNPSSYIYHASVGVEAMDYFGSWQSNFGPTKYSQDLLGLLSVQYTLEIYQGAYLGGGEVQAIDKAGNPNYKLLSNWNRNPVWMDRFIRTYSAFQNLAAKDSQYSFLMENIIQ